MKNTFDIDFIHIMSALLVFMVLTFMSQHPIVDHRPHCCLSSTSLNIYIMNEILYTIQQQPRNISRCEITQRKIKS